MPQPFAPDCFLPPFACHPRSSRLEMPNTRPTTPPAVLSYLDLVREGEVQTNNSMASTQAVQGSIYVHPRGESDDVSSRPSTPPLPRIHGHAAPTPGATRSSGPPTRSYGSLASASGRRFTAGTPDVARRLADSSLDSNGLGSGDETLELSMLAASIGSGSVAAMNALMLTMGKLKKKEGHGMKAKLRPADCWIEDNLFKVRCEGDAEIETWDLGQCKVVPPHKLDRIKLQMTSSGSQGLRELNLHGSSRLEAQMWLRAIVARQEVMRVQNDCSAILKRMQEAHDRIQRQLSHQIEIIMHASEAWEEECGSLSQKVEKLQLEVSRWQSTYADLHFKHEKSERQAQALEEEVRVQQVTAAARAEQVEAQMEEAREEANAQVEVLLQECQELQQKIKSLPPDGYLESVEVGLDLVLDMAANIEAQLAECISGKRWQNLEAVRQQQKMDELRATVQAVLLNHEGDVEGFCRIPLQVVPGAVWRVRTRMHVKCAQIDVQLRAMPI